MAELGEFAEAWIPDEGDVIRGIITELNIGYSDYGNYPIIVIDKSDGTGEQAVHAFHTALQSRLSALRPVPGDVIGIKFLGEKVAKNGRTRYKGYAVKLDGKVQADFWGAPVNSEFGKRPTGTVVSPEPPAQLIAQDIADDDDIPF